MTSKYAGLMAAAMAKKKAENQPTPPKPTVGQSVLKPDPEAESKPAPPSNPVAVPKANLLLSAVQEEPESKIPAAARMAEDDTDSASPMVNDVRELSQLDTTNLEPRTAIASNINVQAQQLTKRLMLDSLDDVRTVCDAVDEIIGNEQRLSGPPLIQLRQYVTSLMATLHGRPEFKDVIIDKDVRNVMVFIQSVRDEALSLREVKEVKRTKRAENAEAKQKQQKLPSQSEMSAAFERLKAKMGTKK